MFRCPFQNCVGGNFVVHDHSAPTGGFSLRTDDGAEFYLTALFQNLKENLHLTLVAESMQKKVVKNQKCCAEDLLYALLVLYVVGSLDGYKLFQNNFTVVVDARMRISLCR